MYGNCADHIGIASRCSERGRLPSVNGVAES